MEQTIDTSLRAHMAAEAEPETSAAAKPVVSTTTTETPEQEAESVKPDAELSEAAKTLRRNRFDERKQAKQREIDELTRQTYETRAELDRLRRERDELSRGHATRPAAAGASTPAGRFYFPEFNTWATGEHEGQTYEAYLDARDDARDEWKAHQSRERIARETHQRVNSATASKLDEQHNAARGKYADFDAVIEAVLVPLRGSARGQVVGDYIASSEVGAEMAYRLGKNQADLRAVIEAQSPAALTRVLARVEHDITASKRAPKPVTTAPAPPSQTVGGGASATDVDTRRGVPLKDHIRIEEAEIAERRRQGYRY